MAGTGEDDSRCVGALRRFCTALCCGMLALPLPWPAERALLALLALGLVPLDALDALDAQVELPLLNKWSMLMDLRSFRPPPIEFNPAPPAPPPPPMFALLDELMLPRLCPIPELPIPTPDIEACGAYELVPKFEVLEVTSPADDRYDEDGCCENWCCACSCC